MGLPLVSMISGSLPWNALLSSVKGFLGICVIFEPFVYGRLYQPKATPEYTRISQVVNVSVDLYVMRTL